MLIPRVQVQGLPEMYPLTGDQTTVGRHPSNDIVLPLDSISRFHARLDRRGEFFILQDLNSSNGSFVNGEKVTQRAIQDGDQVTFGNVEFAFSNEEQRQPQSGSASLVGKNIVDIRDDDDEAKPTTESVIRAEEISSSKSKSSVISSVTDAKIDKATLVKLNHRLSALYRLSEVLRDAEGGNEQDLMEHVLEVLLGAVNADRGVALTRFNREAEQLDVAAVKYRDIPIVQDSVKVSRTILDQVLRERIAVLSRDASVDSRFASSESIIMNRIRSTICAPMTVGENVIGALFLDTTQDGKQFAQDDLEFVMIVATEVGVAVSNMRMQSEAVHRQRLAAVGETVAGISHNVKNILLLSQGGAELLSRALDKNDLSAAKDAWQVVSRGIDKIGKLVRDMLEFSSNKQPEFSPVDINEMICSIAEEVEKQLIAKNVTLELDLDEELKERSVDELGLQRTLMNLIVNAMESITHKEGEIVVTTSRRANQNLLITVKDNGTGIARDKLERIWFPFYTTKGSAGTGLGLPMCKKCIEDMGGTVICQSEENIGTTFTIEIPPQGQG